jgi:hypothetical protein
VIDSACSIYLLQLQVDEISLAPLQGQERSVALRALSKILQVGFLTSSA